MPHLIIGRIHEIIVKEGNIISDPFFRFRDSKAICSAAVPLLTAMANFLFTENANFFSKGMVFCLEILIKSKILNAKVAEIPITLFKDGRKNAKSHLRTTNDELKTSKFILMFCQNSYIFSPYCFFEIIPLIIKNIFKILFGRRNIKG